MAGNVNGDQIVIGTSLAPFNLNKQINAVRSWIENGFYVVSCNTKEEINILKETLENIPIEFIEIDRTAEDICGKKLPYVQDILNIVSSKAQKVCGFVNSDILLYDMTDAMYKFILEEAKDSLIFGRRNEISKYDDIQNLKWEINFDGIDLFFMDTHLAKNFYDDGFYVQSGWDLCILIKCKLLGIKVKEIVNPIAFHLRHKIQWNFNETGMLVKKFMEKYFRVSKFSYKYASDLYYEILCDDCQQICFCDTQKYRCLFVLNQNNCRTIESIKNQDYLNKEIMFSDAIENSHFDIVLYIHGELVLSDVFCKTIIYIMDRFDCGVLNVGRFFASERNRKTYYNQLSRNLKVVKRINSEADVFTKAVRKGGENSGTLYLPISYEVLNIGDRELKKVDAVFEKAYIMPAGVRASEWYDTNKTNLKWEIIGYIDNDESKVGNQINGLQVYSGDVLKNNKDAFVIVVSKYYSEEIEEQLSNIIDKDKILNANYMFYINSDATIEYFDLDKYIVSRKERDNA